MSAMMLVDVVRSVHLGSWDVVGRSRCRFSGLVIIEVGVSHDVLHGSMDID